MTDDMPEHDVAELRREVRELREDLTLLRLAQDRLANISMLNIALPGRGVIGYEGPCRFDMPRALVCEGCGGRIDNLGYELQLHRGRVYMCKGCFDETVGYVFSHGDLGGHH